MQLLVYVEADNLARSVLTFNGNIAGLAVWEREDVEARGLVHQTLEHVGRVGRSLRHLSRTGPTSG